jgi:cell division protein ZapA (FtsZ GTPase activity inhibitor)
LVQQIKVGILGQEYTIHTQADRAYVEKVGEHVASKCQEARDSLRSSSLATITVLAALNIASDYLQMKEAYEQLLVRIENTQEKLASLLA